MLIHQGTQITSQFSVVDKDGNVLETYTISPQKDKVDPLFIRIFNEESFKQAFLSISSLRDKIEEKYKYGE